MQPPKRESIQAVQQSEFLVSAPPCENAVPDRKHARSIRSKLFGWWYVAIGAGFLLLSINRILVGGSSFLIALRLLIAAGFFLLGYLELHSKLRR